MKYYKTKEEAIKNKEKSDYVFYVKNKGFAIIKVSRYIWGKKRPKIDGSWIIFISAIILMIVGILLSEPTYLGRYHPLIGDSMILVSIWYISKYQL